jgi:hypothetical protein
VDEHGDVALVQELQQWLETGVAEVAAVVVGQQHDAVRMQDVERVVRAEKYVRAGQ